MVLRASCQALLSHNPWIAVVYSGTGPLESYPLNGTKPLDIQLAIQSSTIQETLNIILESTIYNLQSIIDNLQSIIDNPIILSSQWDEPTPQKRYILHAGKSEHVCWYFCLRSSKRDAQLGANPWALV
jgi:hypothetical protein